MARIIPARISAGVTFDTLATAAAYPAPDWALRVILRGPAVINLAAVAEGLQHRVLVTATETADWAPGRYSYAVRVTKDADVRDIEAGTLEILQNLDAIDAATDMRSINRRTLDAINAVIEKRASRDQERYTIGDRELWRTPIADLLKLRGYYAGLCRREDAAGSGAHLWGAAVKVRF